MKSIKHFAFIVVLGLGCVEFAENLPEIHHLRKRAPPPGKYVYKIFRKYAYKKFRKNVYKNL